MGTTESSPGQPGGGGSKDEGTSGDQPGEEPQEDIVDLGAPIPLFDGGIDSSEGKVGKD